MEIQLQEDRIVTSTKGRTADQAALSYQGGYALQDALCPAQDRGKFMFKAKVCVNRRGQSGSLLAAVVIAMIGGASSAKASIIFTEDFNSYTGTLYANQADTGDQLAYAGSVTGWTGAGFHAVHAVEVGSGDWAVMLYSDNSITLDTGVAANDAGENYVVSFDYGTANYNSESQGTGVSDGLIVELLRGDNTVLAEQTYMPGAWGPGNYDLEAGLQGTLSYIGDGTGDLRIEILDSNPTDPVFGGSIDNITLSSAPEPGGLVLAGPGLAVLGWFMARRRRLVI
jgi:hypothetical protein